MQTSRQTVRVTPTMSWVAVPGPDGRTRMEMRWHVGTPVPTTRRSAA